MLLAVHYRVMEHLGSLESTQEARVALGYRLGQLLRFFRALQIGLVHTSDGIGSGVGIGSARSVTTQCKSKIGIGSGVRSSTESESEGSDEFLFLPIPLPLPSLPIQ